MNRSSDSNTVDVYRLDEPRRTCSFKGNYKLWKAFVSFSKTNYGSVCHILEPTILAIIQAQVVQSSTIRPIVIENLVIERAVKRIRRYSKEVFEEEEVANVEKCWFCKKAAVDTFLFVRTNKTYPLCKFHVRGFVGSRGNWRVVQKEDSVESVRKECL